MKFTISNAHIKDKTRRKTNPSLKETIVEARKNKSWNQIAHILSGPTAMHSSVNLKEVDTKTTAGDTIIIPGKLLASGDLAKKVRICAISASQSALDKLKATKSEFVSIMEEIKQNPKAQGLKLIR